MINLNSEQKVNLTAVAKTVNNKQASIDGQFLWSCSDTNVISLVIAPDGLTAYAIANSPGLATVSVLGDADLGTNTREITASVDFTVVAAEASKVEITVGTIENQ